MREIINLFTPGKEYNSDREHIYTLSIALECIAGIAKAFGSEFKPMVKDYLYPTLRILGHPHQYASYAAWSCLDVISKSCDHKDVYALVNANHDYLIDTIVHHFRYLDLFPDTLDVLSALLRHCGQSMVGIIKDVAICTLDALDQKYKPHRLKLLRILLHILTLLSTKTDKKEEEKKETSLSDFFDSRIQQLRNRLNARKQLRDRIAKGRNASKDEEEDKIPEDLANNEEQDDEIDEDALDLDNPAHVMSTLVVDILSKLQHFTAVKSLPEKSVVMECIGVGITALQASPQLLQTANKLWEPLSNRFLDTDSRILTKALGVMKVLSMYCKDFLQRRTSASFWPIMKDKIKELAENLEIAFENKDVYISHQMRKTVAILECLHIIVSSVFTTRDEKILRDISRTCTNFLAPFMPLKVQKLAVTLFEDIQAKDGDYIWLQMEQDRIPLNQTKHRIQSCTISSSRKINT